jgi:AcrR family transcriptional regulator
MSSDAGSIGLKTDKMAKTRQQQKIETREKLIAAGAIVFARRGLEGTRIADIGREAGVAVGTLYTHFRDKEALFEAVMRAGKAMVIAGLELAREAPSREARDHAAMAGVVAFASAYGALFRLLLSRGASGDPLQREVVDAITALRVEELIEGQANGWARSDLEAEACARCEVGAVFHLLDWWLEDRSRLSEEELISQLSLVRRFGVEGLIPPNTSRM